MMGTVNERTLLKAEVSPTAAVAPCAVSPAPELRPVVLSSEWHRGDRVSRVLRADGSIFTVTVPRPGVDECTQHLARQQEWISDDSGRSELSIPGFLRLAAVAGVPGVGNQLVRR
jgi:hypothetical protein